MKEKLKVLLFLLLCMLLFTGCSSSCKTDGCENEHIEDSKYCTEHVCAETDCLNGKIGENYCLEHFNCSVEGCKEERVLDGRYCSTHKCNISDCAKIKKGENYCEKHQCVTTGCDNIRTSENYCDTHYACSVGDCLNERALGSLYCMEHKCSDSNCFSARIKNTSYCYKHGGNYKQGTSNSTSSSKATSTTYPYSLTEEQKLVLWIDAKSAVKDKLKSPSSAKFPSGLTASGVTFHYNNSNGTASIWGWVEAENSYGSVMKEEWLVDFKISSDGKRFQMTNIEFF